MAARQNNFAITTPTAVPAVRGTTFYASVDSATGTTSFLCTEGLVVIQVMVNGVPRTVTITAGQVTTVALGQAPSAPAPPAAITLPTVATTGAGTSGARRRRDPTRNRKLEMEME